MGLIESSLLASEVQIDGPQQQLAEGTREALSTLTQALQATQLSAFKQVRAQFSQLALENRQLREQLGEGTASISAPDHNELQATVVVAKPAVTSLLGKLPAKSQGIVQLQAKPKAKPKARPSAQPTSEAGAESAVAEASAATAQEAADAQTVDPPESFDVTPTRPSGQCAVLQDVPAAMHDVPEHIEAFTLPHALVAAGFDSSQTRPRSRDAWRPAGADAGCAVAKPSQPEDSDRLDVTVSWADSAQSNLRHLSSIDEKEPQMRGARARWSQQLRRTKKSNWIRNSFPTYLPDVSDRRSARMSNKSRLFPDKTELMEQVQQGLVKPEYKVSNFYHKDGVAQLLATNPIFESLTLVVIVLNSVWIAIDTDYNTEPLDPEVGFIVVDNLFCGFFFAELLVRFLAFERKWNCRLDHWFVFDSVLVTVAVLETWVMHFVELASGVTTASLTGRSGPMLRLLRMARLARTARMARLLRAVPELMIMFKGMRVACKAVTSTIFLLAIIIYVFALCMRQLTVDTSLAETHFPSVPSSMGLLLLRGTLPDVADFVYDLSGSHILLGSIGLCFVLLTVLVVLNMLAGVLVNVVLIVADLEKEEADATFVRNALPVILDLSDTDGDQQISKAEFDKLLTNPDATTLLEQVNVDVMGLVELSDFIFCSAMDSLKFEDFFKLLLKLRGSNTATVKDIVEMRKFIVKEVEGLEFYLGGMLKQVLSQVTHTNPDLL